MAYSEDINQASLLDIPWDILSGKNILVTGATGLIGSVIVEILLNRGGNYHIYASGRNLSRIKVRFNKYLKNENLHFLKYDVTQPLDSNIDFHFIISAASGANPKEYSKDPVGVMKANIMGTDNLLSYGIIHHLEKFVYVSSGEIYGEGDGRAFDEKYSGYVDCATVRACYPSSKRATETLCMAYASQYGVDISIARPSHVYGPYFTESDSRVYAQFIRNVLMGEDIVMKSTGSQFRSWCYVVDCASAILYILLKGKNGEAYNIADSRSNISIKELAQLVAEIGGKRVVIDVPVDEERKGFNVVKKSVFLTEKIEQLGWKPMTHIEQGIKNTINELRS